MICVHQVLNLILVLNLGKFYDSQYGGVDAFEEFVDKFGEIQVVTINKVIAVRF